jgi:Flp pilus assembly CpaE family ATPase
MSKKPLTVLLIEDSPAYAELVQVWLSSKDGAFVLNWADSLKAGLNRLSRGGIDVILLDLGLPDSEGGKTLVAAQAHGAGVPIVVLSANEDESLALKAIRDGAQDYIEKSSCNGELLAKAIQCAVLRHGHPAATAGEEYGADRTRVIGVIGAKGGVGATTVACNLAVELRRQTEQKVLLADLDVNGGMVSFMMNCAPEHSILDAVSNIHRLELSWDSIVTHGDNDLHIVRSPGLLGVDDPDAGKIGDVLTFVRGFYRWIVLDLGRLSVLSLSLLDKIDSLFLVTGTTVPALFEAKRVMGGLRRAGIDAERILLIVNQLANTPEFSSSELQQIFGMAPYAKLPDASPEFRDVRMQGRLPSENGVFRENIARLARRVAGLPEEESRRSLSQFLSFGGKSRRAETVAPSGA